MVKRLFGSYRGPRYWRTAAWQGSSKLLMSTALATSNMWSSRHWTNDGLSGEPAGQLRQVPLWALLNTTLARLSPLGASLVSGEAVNS